MIFSAPVQYAIRAMTYLGEQEVGKLSSIREISRAAGIPMPYLAKIINRLSRRNSAELISILESLCSR